jgi:nicotinamidase-related amidase
MKMKIGNSNHYWIINDNEFDISRGSIQTAVIDIEDNRKLKFDPDRSALIVIDMQNFFCSPLLGRPDGALNLVPAIKSAVSSSRSLGMKVVWLNWGNRKDIANLPPSLLYAFKQLPDNPGIGEQLPNEMGLSLVKDTWSAALVDELVGSYEPEDWWIDKYRVSGFYGTVLDQTLRSNGINTLFFAGVNTDQCVMGTMQDGAFLGYDSVMLRDCTATTSPSYTYEASMYNVKASLGGFITSSANLKGIRD